MTLTQNQFYCVSCKKKKTSTKGDICATILRNGQAALKSECSKCGTNLTKFIKNDSYSAAKRKYGEC